MERKFERMQKRMRTKGYVLAKMETIHHEIGRIYKALEESRESEDDFEKFEQFIIDEQNLKKNNE